MKRKAIPTALYSIGSANRRSGRKGTVAGGVLSIGVLRAEAILLEGMTYPPTNECCKRDEF
ncbi:MAG: hypothetical protein NVS4B5_20250 [Vulcanimicrobiaceae bacterium]